MFWGKPMGFSANLEDDDVCPFFLRWWSRLWSSLLLLLLLLLFWEHVTNTCTSIKHDYGKNVFEIIINNSSKGKIKLNNPEMLSPVTTLNFLKSIISLSFYARANLDIDIAVCWNICCPNKVFQPLLNTPSQWFCCMSCTSRSTLAMFTKCRFLQF